MHQIFGLAILTLPRLGELGWIDCGNPEAQGMLPWGFQSAQPAQPLHFLEQPVDARLLACFVKNPQRFGDNGFHFGR
jgi:hypothetical protein